MPRFLIEFDHDNDHEGCIRSLSAIMAYGSHLVTHAEYGCADDVHTGWLIVDVDDRETARQMIPPQYRGGSRIVLLRKWTQAQIREMVKTLPD